MNRLLPVAALSVALLASACTGRAGVGAEAPGGRLAGLVGAAANGVIDVGDRQPAPSLSGRTLQGAPLSVGDLRGKVVVVNFWASWCPPCRAEAPNLNAVAAQTKAAGVAFVGINIKDDHDAAKAMERAKAVPYPSLEDQAGLLLLKFRGQAPQTPPTTFVLDRQGRIAARYTGPLTEDGLLAPVQQLAAESA